MTRLLAVLALFLLHAPAFAAPNIVLIFTDDQGYGDLGCYGATGFTTPNIGKLARGGIRFTDFHVTQPVCSASRAALLTGCYSNRIGIHGALGPNARHGINANETTLAEMLKSKGYSTGMVGKWHLGHYPQFLPTRHGFDSYYGLPYSNDMWPHHPEAKSGTFPPLPLFDNETVIIKDVQAEDQTRLTTQYTERTVKFIDANKSKPFFLYVAHSMPHVPLHVSDECKLTDNTLVMFATDNGPWLSYGNHGGTAGKLREGKGTVWEGGVRVPFIARWPGTIPAGSECRIPAMTIDLFPTLAKIVGAELPKLAIDGKDIGALLRNESNAKSPHEAFYHYYNTGELQAIRSGKWKLMLPHTYRTMQGQAAGKDGKPGRYRQVKIAAPELYDLDADVGESKDVAADNPDVVAKLLAYAEAARDDLGDSLTKRVGKGVRQPGRLPGKK